MGAPKPLEEALLVGADAIIGTALNTTREQNRTEARLQILEAAAAMVGGYSYNWYCGTLLGRSYTAVVDAIYWSRQLIDELSSVPIHTSLALSSLARPRLNGDTRRRTGSYYTDFRLATFLARQACKAQLEMPIIDLASGTGILLVAFAQEFSNGKQTIVDQLLSDSIYAADLSSDALRGAKLALSSLTSNEDAITKLHHHFKQGDSLTMDISLWGDVVDGFGVVIGNPPWEKLKLSRHEFLIANGNKRHYGADYNDGIDYDALEEQRGTIEQYKTELSRSFSLQGNGEHDLYKLFLEKAISYVKDNGGVYYLVPAGLIRSSGTRSLRESLFKICSDIQFSVFENKAKFFAIDTRFKFLAIEARLCPNTALTKIAISIAKGTPSAVEVIGNTLIPRNDLMNIRPDLTLPEVRSAEEWRIFHDSSSNGVAFGDEEGYWKPEIVREVDMTGDRDNFEKLNISGTIPLIEGRMLHQYRHSVKHYYSGTGRSATWLPTKSNVDCLFKPQYWYPVDELPSRIRSRASKQRVGFCDITGQTNERTMLAAAIPANVVCGNKVPTVTFNIDEDTTIVQYCWLAIANSLPFDWLIRRVVTTTVNFFILLGMPFPKLDPLSTDGIYLSKLAERLSRCQHLQLHAIAQSDNQWEQACIRAEIDWRILYSYGLGLSDLVVMMQDFPLLDRSQIPLKGEKRSTISRDFLLLQAAEGLDEGSVEQRNQLRIRVEAARELGAVPYIPSHLLQ